MDRRVIQCHCSTRESCRREERCERVKVGWQETNVKGEGNKTGRIFRGKAYLEKKANIRSRERIAEKDFPLMELISIRKYIFFFTFERYLFIHLRSLN